MVPYLLVKNTKSEQTFICGQNLYLNKEKLLRVTLRLIHNLGMIPFKNLESIFPDFPFHILLWLNFEQPQYFGIQKLKNSYFLSKISWF